MLVVFKYPRKLGHPAKLYLKSPAPQQVPDKDAKGWYFDALVKSGEIALPGAASEAKPVLQAKSAEPDVEEPKVAESEKKAAPSQPQNKKG